MTSQMTFLKENMLQYSFFHHLQMIAEAYLNSLLIKLSGTNFDHYNNELFSEDMVENINVDFFAIAYSDTQTLNAFPQKWRDDSDVQFVDPTPLLEKNLSLIPSLTQCEIEDCHMIEFFPQFKKVKI